MGISSISQIDISSVCFECLTNDGSMRTIKTKSYLNSLSLLTVSRFIHHLRRETVSQTLLMWTQVKFLTLPELSDFHQWDLTLQFVSLLPCTLTVEKHWPDAALTACQLLAFRSFLLPLNPPGITATWWSRGRDQLLLSVVPQATPGEKGEVGTLVLFRQ